MFSDIEEYEELMDDVIAKGFKKVKKSKIEVHEEEIAKSLSHDPFNPQYVGPESELEFHIPYKWVDNGFMPFPASHWESKDKQGGYETVERLYRNVGKSLKALRKIGENADIIIKAEKVPIGTVHTYHDGQKYKKLGEGNWQPVSETKGHLQHPDLNLRQAANNAIEDHASQIIKVKAALAKKEKMLAQAQSKSDKAEPTKKNEQSGTYKPDGDKQEILGKKIAGLPKELFDKIAKKGPGRGTELKLSSQELTTILKSGTFALVSAGKNPNHEEDKKLDDETIKKRYETLQDNLKHAGYVYTKVKGVYGGEEDSYLVMVHDADKDHIKAIGKQLNQDLIVFSEAGEHEMIFTTGSKAGQHHKGNGFEKVADASDMYSEAETTDGKKIKFKLSFDFDKEHSGEEETVGKHDVGQENIKDTSANAKRHSVTVEFTRDGQKYNHTFDNVNANTMDEAKAKITQAISSRFKGAEINSIKTKGQSKERFQYT